MDLEVVEGFNYPMETFLFLVIYKVKTDVGDRTQIDNDNDLEKVFIQKPNLI